LKLAFVSVLKKYIKKRDQEGEGRNPPKENGEGSYTTKGAMVGQNKKKVAKNRVRPQLPFKPTNNHQTSGGGGVEGWVELT